MKLGPWRFAAVLLLGELSLSPITLQAEVVQQSAEQNVTYRAKTVKPMRKFKKTMTTIFWVGEDANSENGYIHNYGSYWDSNWMKHFGGIDSPLHRNGYMPAAFTPKQNPFYIALPFAEVDANGKLKEIAKSIPGFSEGQTQLTKNRWLEIRYKGKSCYAQWADVGPYVEDDFDWVFGDALKPKNTQGLKAGLDISPAAAQYLGMSDSDKTEWRFVEEKEVPSGPWKAIVTR